MKLPTIEGVAFVSRWPPILQDYYVKRGITVINLTPKSAVLRRVAFKAGIRNDTIFQIENLKNKRLVVLSENLVEYASWYKDKLPNAMVVVWFNNTLNNENSFYRVARDIPVYTFDPDDAKRYNLRYQPQFYPFIVPQKGESIPKTAFFMGLDKGRQPLLKKIDKTLKSCGYASDFRIIADDRSDMSEYPYWTGGEISYAKQLYLNLHAEITVDIVKPQQKGLTLRMLEAMGAHHKVITNCPLVKEFSFYNKNNIFIIEESQLNVDELRSFLSAPKKESFFDYVYQYDISRWIDRIALDS